MDLHACAWGQLAALGHSADLILAIDDGLLSRLPSSDTVDVAAVNAHVSQLQIAETGKHLHVVPVSLPSLNEVNDR